MKPTRTMRRIVERMARIGRMERGTICQMTGRKQYNHQTWRQGRNVARYVPADRVASLQEAIEGYKRFMELAEEYADEVVRRTRAEFPLTGAPRRTRGKGR